MFLFHNLNHHTRQCKIVLKCLMMHGSMIKIANYLTTI